VEKKINVPDIGGAKDVDLIEILVKVGDSVEKESSLLVLESDKASMEIPSPEAGVIRVIHVKVGDKMSEGDLMFTMEVNTPEIKAEPKAEPRAEPEPESKTVIKTDSAPVLASPAVRRQARMMDVDLSLIKGTGRKDRISKEDLAHYAVDPVNDMRPLNRIKRLTGLNVYKAWSTIPHVTQFDEADITDLEAFRKNEAKQVTDYKLTLLAFVCKVVSKALRVFPQFNTSLDSTGEKLIYKQYVNIGIAVETSNGLVVPVIHHVDNLSVIEIANEMTRLSTKARDKGLMPKDMSDGCFTISSLGGIGGTAFTPIVNSPEVAILGLSRSAIKPVYMDGQFVPRLMLPLSLSYDHRVIDGAEGARFTKYLSETLSDIRRIIL
jgi:pyruvate dehydrogenase E2 component (dihydrolipoamide acetyltransferase)